MQNMQEKYQEVVNYFGNQVRTADKIGVKQPSVHAWLSGKAKMSSENALKVENLTNGKFKAVDLCPRLAEIEQIKTPSGN